LPPEAFIGKRVDDIGFPTESVEQLKRGMKRALEESLMTSYEYTLDHDRITSAYEGRIVPIASDRILLVVRDITENRTREDRLRISLLEKEILLKEIHHRVKNNMQVISSLIQLQSYTIRDRELLKETQARIRAMATVHELLYESQDFSSIYTDKYLESIVEELSLGYDAVNVRCDVQPVQVDIDTAVPLGLIANELIINAIKYAYDPGVRGPIRVSLRQEGDDIVFSVSDDGKGLPAGIDPETSDTMGLTLVRSLTSQLCGGISFGGAPGFRAELRFSALLPKH
jgi:two-component sensor histidine kinase